MDTTAAKPASSSGGDNGASRTFQSLFGGESGRDSHAQHPKPSSERIPAMNSTNASANADDDDADVWDDDFPSDATMESAEEDNGGSSNESKRQALSSESRQSMSEWADNDDDEDQWKDALQARVDQLELVVEKKAAPPTPQLHASQMQNDHHHLPQQAVKTTTTPYAPPVDQRATLTLVPKTNLLRSISAPPAGDESKPTSKLKAPQVVRSPTATMVGNSAGIKPSTPTGGSQQRVDGGVSTGDQARKRSNSRDYLTRTALAKDHKQPAKSTTPPAAAASNSVFVRAVVARGNSTAGRHAPEPRIANETTHVDKRAKADDRAAVLALSDAEAVRRYILNDVKKMSVERIIADAKRLQFLEDLHRRQPDANEAKRSASSTGGVPASAPTKKRAV